MPDDAYFEAIEKQREARAGSRQESATPAATCQPLARQRDSAHQTTHSIHEHNNEGGSHE
jgi:hypothetical protein